MKRLIPLLVVSVVLFFQGCAPKPAPAPLADRVATRPSEASERGSGQRGPGNAAAETDKGKRGTITEEDLSARSDEESKKGIAGQTAGKEQIGQLQDIYFEFDSYNIRTEDIPVLKGIAAWLATRSATKLTIEGHCDERGTTDYNLALGQKRAEAAKDYLVKLGVSDKRMKAVSYGKEAPLDPGHSEQAWTKNRRVHFTSP
jgi:peptidoglycan-associated lipoprotein